MSWKDEQKKAYGEAKNYAKLNPDFRLKMSEEKGVSVFRMSVKKDDGSYQNYDSSEPLIGVIIGEAMMFSAFDQSFGKSGGTFRSAPYLDSDKICLFDPTGKVAVKGTKDDCKAFIAKNTNAKEKVSRLTYFKTKKGLIEITSNMTMSIDESKKSKSLWADNVLKLTPRLYDPADKTLSKDTHKFLKVAIKNRPSHFFIEVVEPITDDIAEDLGLVESYKMFNAWKESLGYESPKAEEKKQDASWLNQNDPIPEPKRNQGYTQQGDEKSFIADTSGLPF